MSRLAEIKEGVVTNVIEGEKKDYPLYVLVEDKVSKGYLYDAEKGKFNAPVNITLNEIPIRIITTGSMQARFSISEEIAITTGIDEIAKVLLSRLFNAKNINLDLDELTSGIAYIVNYLDTINAVYEEVSASERIDQLLSDGTPDEKFIGQ